MEENRNKQENVRDLLRENLELIRRIDVMTEENFKIIKGNFNIAECSEENSSDMDKNILELVITQREILREILKTMQETIINLIG